jgi:alkaline phosphatase
MIADGWGQKQIEATNKYNGNTPLYQQSGAGWSKHWLSTFPSGGSYSPTQAWSSFNYVLQNPTDSAGAATALYTGSKTQNFRISTSGNGTNRLFSIGEKAKTLGKSVGAVSTVPVSHATPGAWTSHNADRVNGYAIADEGFFGNPNATGQSSEPFYAGGFGPTLPPVDVLIGDRRTNYVNNTIRDTIVSDGIFELVERASGQDGGANLLAAANDPNVTKLAGLFDHVFHNADGSGFDPETPTLADSTTAALKVLSRNSNGFVLLVEGGAVDWAGHSNNMNQMIGELKDFNEAVQSVIDWVNNPTNDSTWSNTLVIVTGDHETGYLTQAPGVFPDQPLGQVNAATIALEKVYAGSNGRRASWVDADGDNVIDAGETVHWAWNTSGHSNSLIPLFVRGAGAESFADHATGDDPVRGAYLDNTDVFSVMDTATGGGGQVAPTVSFNLSTSSGSEATTPANLAVSLSASSSSTVTVNYAVTGGTATSGSDYTIAAGPLTFDPGQTTRSINLTIINDALAEGNETVQITLSNPTNATLGANVVHTYTINDNDSGGDGGLVVAYGFGEGSGTTTQDSSGNDNDGTLINGPVWVAGQNVGFAVSFDGSDDYVETGNTTSLPHWTISAWVRSPNAPSSAAASGPINRNSNYQINWNHPGATFRGAAAVQVGGTYYAATFGPLLANTWYYLAATYDGETLKAFKNGALITSNTAPSGVPNAETNSLKLGRHSLAAQFFRGTVDEVRVYNRALSPAEIQEDMVTPVAP